MERIAQSANFELRKPNTKTIINNEFSFNCRLIFRSLGQCDVASLTVKKARPLTNAELKMKRTVIVRSREGMKNENCRLYAEFEDIFSQQLFMNEGD
jgi:ribosomal protein L14